MKRNYVLLAFLLILSTTTIVAQESRSQWFVSGGAHSVIALNGSANASIGGKISGGVWFNGYTGLRLNVEAGNIWMKGDYTATTFGGGLDWMVNLLSLDPDRKFGLNAFMGVGINHYSLDKNYGRHSKINDVLANFSIQATYKLSPSVSLYLEPGVRVGSKFYDLENKKDAYASGTVSAGVIINL